MSTAILRPNAAGDECNIQGEIGAACPNHYQNVDEVIHDGDATLVYQVNTIYFRDLYHLQDHTSETGVINSVTVFGYVRNSTGIGYTVKFAIKTGVTAYNGADQADTGTANYVLKSEAWATNPQTGVAWTWADIDALQAGISLKSATAGDGASCTQLYVEVDYTTFFSGIIHEILISNRALSAQEIKQLYLNPYDMFLR